MKKFYTDIQKEKIKRTLYKRYVEAPKNNYLLYIEKDQRSLNNVTYDKLISDGKITVAGWGFLRELAIHVRSKYYPRYKEKEDLTLDLILKGAKQILDYKGDFIVKNWRNYIYSGMRNTASNANYYKNKDRIKIMDVSEEDFRKYYEKYLKVIREEETIEIDQKDSNEENNLFDENIKTIINRVFFNKKEKAQILFDFLYNEVKTEETEEEYFEEPDKIKKRLRILNEWNR
jgi:hypothetical protein